MTQKSLAVSFTR